MSVSLSFVDSISPLRFLLLKRISEGQSTVRDLFADVADPKGWKPARTRVHNDVQKLERLGFVDHVMIGNRRKAYRITEQGRKTLRKAQSFYETFFQKSS